MTNVDFTSVDFTKPIEMDILGHFEDVTYIGPYKARHVVAFDNGYNVQYYTTDLNKLRNKPLKPTTKQLYDSCVQLALIEGFGWANQEKILELLYQELVSEGLIKEES